MTILRVAFRTLGCKLNQLETESIADAFSAVGAAVCPFDEAADLYVVNTCTVTSKAEQKARRTIRQALLQNPQAAVLVTGCYAQMDPDGLSVIHPRSVVVPGDEKSALLNLAGWLQDHWQGHGDLLDAVAEWKLGLSVKGGASPDRFAYHPRSFAFHSRPSIKIEDGCNNRCTYCRVCLARGPAVSLQASEVLARVRALEDAGKSEAVLTGVNLSQYRDGSTGFPELLEYLVEKTRNIRFRISSYEPERVNEAFLKAFALQRVQPHVHLAMQSGSTAVLRRMARPYDAKRLREAVGALRSARQDPFIAADLIAGFPGETDVEFEETLALCRELDLAWIHAFPFSARPGTKAFDMRPKIPERMAGERVSRLSALALAGKARYVDRWIGETVEVILERGDVHDDDADANAEEPTFPRSPNACHIGTSPHAYRIGTSANYLKVAISGVPDSLEHGALVKALLHGRGFAPGIDARAGFVAAES